MYDKKQKALVISLVALCAIALPTSYAFSRHSADKIKQNKIAQEEQVRAEQEEKEKIAAEEQAKKEAELDKKIKLEAKENYKKHKKEAEQKEKLEAKAKEEKKKERIKKLEKEKEVQDKEAKELSTNTYSEATGTNINLDKEFKEAKAKVVKPNKKDKTKKTVQKQNDAKVKDGKSKTVKKENNKDDDDLSWLFEKGSVLDGDIFVSDEENAKDLGMTVKEYKETKKKAKAGDKKAFEKIYGTDEDIKKSTLVDDPNEEEGTIEDWGIYLADD